MKNDPQARDWSVYPVQIDDETFTYAKVRALEGALGMPTATNKVEHA